MTPKPEYVLELAEKIVKAKAEVETLQQEWDAIFKTSATLNLFPKTRAVRDGSFSGKVEGIITGEPGRLFTIGQVASAIGTPDTLKVGRTLFRLYKTKRIDNPERGMYKAKKSEAA